jgi:hypothetical protein
MPKTVEEKFKAASSLLGPHDNVRRQTTEMIGHGYEIFSIAFRATEHDDVVSINVYDNGTFRVGRSSSVPTERFAAYTAAYNRSLAVVVALGLKPVL